MAKLPTATDLGGLPSARSGRVIASWDQSAIGAGMADYGAAVAQAGDALGAFVKTATSGLATREGYDAKLSAQEFVFDETNRIHEMQRNAQPGDLRGFTERWQQDFTKRAKTLVGGTPASQRQNIDQALFSAERQLFPQIRKFEEVNLLDYAITSIDERTNIEFRPRAAQALTTVELDRITTDLKDLVRSNPDLTPIEMDRIVRERMREIGLSFLENKTPEEIEGYLGTATQPITAENLLKTDAFEGFRSEPYFDVDKLRIGYGSDTITRKDGTVETVVPGMKITRADADRDLKRRLDTEFLPRAIKKIGKENWNNLPGPVQAVLGSLTYNGALTSDVVSAAKNRDLDKLAEVILSKESDLPGVLRRRAKEADIVLSAKHMWQPAKGTDWKSIKVTHGYKAAGKIRQLDIKPHVDQWARTAAASLSKEIGKSVELFYISGGQHDHESKGPRTGSHRHDHGGAVDLQLVVNGRKITPAQDPGLYKRYLAYAAAAGAPGLGHYPGHVHVGGGSVAAWGPNGSKDTLGEGYRIAIEQGRAMAQGGGEYVGSAALPEALRTLKYEDWQDLATAAEKRVTKEEEDLEKTVNEEITKEGYALMVDDKLTREWVDANEDILDKTDYKALIKATDDKRQKRTDPKEYLRLLDLADENPQIALEESRRLYGEDLIAKDVFNTVQSRARKTIAGTTPTEKYDTEMRQYVRTMLRPDADAPKSHYARQLDGAFAFDDWLEKNPAASRDEMRKAADTIAKNYRQMRYRRDTTDLKPPKFLDVSQPITVESVNQAKAKTLLALQRGGMTKQEAAKQAELLKIWSGALRDD